MHEMGISSARPQDRERGTHRGSQGGPVSLLVHPALAHVMGSMRQAKCDRHLVVCRILNVHPTMEPFEPIR